MGDGDFVFGGVHHVALVSSDMARTVDFYTNVLGMPLVKTLELPDGGQHFFFDCGKGDCVAFFWYPDWPKAVPGVASASSLRHWLGHRSSCAGASPAWTDNSRSPTRRAAACAGEFSMTWLTSRASGVCPGSSGSSNHADLSRSPEKQPGASARRVDSSSGSCLRARGSCMLRSGGDACGSGLRLQAFK